MRSLPLFVVAKWETCRYGRFRTDIKLVAEWENADIIRQKFRWTGVGISQLSCPLTGVVVSGQLVRGEPIWSTSALSAVYDTN